MAALPASPVLWLEPSANKSLQLNKPVSLFQEASIDLRDGELIHHSPWLSEREANELFQQLFEQLDWQQLQVKIFGKTHNSPRLSALYGDPGISYRYSSMTHQALAWHPLLLELNQRLSNEFNLTFNSTLANLYRDGQDAMGWHADDEPELGINPTIASINLGETRIFKFKHRATNERYDLPLQHGDLLIMKGKLQHHWMHAILKQNTTLNPRINLTYRMINNV